MNEEKRARAEKGGADPVPAGKMEANRALCALVEEQLTARWAVRHKTRGRDRDLIDREKMMSGVEGMIKAARETAPKEDGNG